MSDRRHRRMEQNLKRIISDIVKYELELKDMDLLTVTDVELTPDFKEGTVYVSYMLDDEEKRTETLKILKRNEKRIRSAVAKQVSIKNIPEFRFREDTSIKRAAQINSIVRDLQEERENRNRE